MTNLLTWREQVLAALRPLLPRLYSISSSMLERERSVQVTVATVRYESLGRPRIGVTSTLLAERLKVQICHLFSISYVVYCFCLTACICMPSV